MELYLEKLNLIKKIVDVIAYKEDGISLSDLYSKISEDQKIIYMIIDEMFKMKFIISSKEMYIDKDTELRLPKELPVFISAILNNKRWDKLLSICESINMYDSKTVYYIINSLVQTEIEKLINSTEVTNDDFVVQVGI